MDICVCIPMYDIVFYFVSASPCHTIINIEVCAVKEMIYITQLLNARNRKFAYNTV